MINAPPLTSEAWRELIAEATALEQAADRDKVAAILEKGQRITAFHAAEKTAKWFKSWDEACRKNIGIDRSTAAMYETAAGNLVGVTNNILPSNLDALYQLGLARRASKEAFDKAIKAGDIHAEMSRADAKDICKKFGGSLRRSPRNRTPLKVAQLLEAVDGVGKELRKWCKKQSNLFLRTPDEQAHDALVELADLMIAKVYSDAEHFALLLKRVEDARASRQQSEAA